MTRRLVAGGCKHVSLSFGQTYETDLDYLQVSNLPTRKIKQVLKNKTNTPSIQAVRTSRSNWSSWWRKPTNCSTAIKPAQTIFVSTAKEMRKYYVTLLSIDRCLSQSIDEVISQLGTRISGWLGDEDDVHAMLSGLSECEIPRVMRPRLLPKEEVLLLGWGVPMPLPVKSRHYNDNFWRKLFGADSKKDEAQIIKELGY